MLKSRRSVKSQNLKIFVRILGAKIQILETKIEQFYFQRQKSKQFGVRIFAICWIFGDKNRETFRKSGPIFIFDLIISALKFKRMNKGFLDLTVCTRIFLLRFQYCIDRHAMNVENDHDDHHHGKCSCHFFHCYFCQRRLGKISHTSITTAVVVRMHVKKTTFSITFFPNSKEEGEFTLC